MQEPVVQEPIISEPFVQQPFVQQPFVQQPTATGMGQAKFYEQPISYPSASDSGAVFPAASAYGWQEGPPIDLPQKTARKFKPSKFIISALAIVLAAALLGGAVYGVLYSLRPKDYVFFYSDGRFSEYSFKDKSVKTLARFDDDYSKARGNGNTERFGDVTENTKFSQNGDRVFYPQNFDGPKNTFTLYMKYTDRPGDRPLKIDSDVLSYDITSDGSKVIYHKYNEGTLYVNEIKNGQTENGQKISSRVSEYYYNEGLTAFIWRDTDGMWYSGKENDKEIKLADGTAGDLTAYVRDNLDVYYLQNGNFYYRPFGKDGIKIDSDVSECSVGTGGTVFYLKKTPAGRSFYDLFDDDMYKSDALITEPAEPDYMSYSDYGKYVEDYNKYRDAYQLYAEKTARDQLRATFKEEKHGFPDSALYSYDGNSSKKLDDGVMGFLTCDCENNRVVYYVCDYDAVKIKFSDLWDDIINSDDVYETLSDEFTRKVIDNLQSRYAVGGGDPVAFGDGESFESSQFDKNGVLYYVRGENVIDSLFGGDTQIFDENEFFSDSVESGRTLLAVDTGSSQSSGKLIAEDVYSYDLTDDNKLYYLTGDSSRSGFTLTVDGSEVDTNVSNVFNIDGDLYYFTDWDADDECGTLKKYGESGNSRIIAKDVNCFAMFGDKLVYLADYKDRSGDLYYYKNPSEKVLLTKSVDYIYGGYCGQS